MIEFVILAGVKHVEAAAPECDRGGSSRMRGSSEPRTAIHAAEARSPWRTKTR